jgi:MtfA peptidase
MDAFDGAGGNDGAIQPVIALRRVLQVGIGFDQGKGFFFHDKFLYGVTGRLNQITRICNRFACCSNKGNPVRERHTMLHWLRDHRRKKIAGATFPESWEETVRGNVQHYCVLDPSEQARLRTLIQVFIKEKYWEGCGGLELTDEIRVIISAQACLLLLGIKHDYYRNVLSILVYPSIVVPPQRKIGFFEAVQAPVDIAHPIMGQAFQQGPVILIWDAVLGSSRHPELGHNVVYHEFAHKLDMLDGAADGTPPLRGIHEYKDWVTICSREFLRLRQDAGKGRKSFLDAYGATNEAEFFAVATEQFFDGPVRLKEQAPDLYRVLREYYNQDPADRVNRSTCEKTIPTR